jgi:hypothetical protein
VSTLRFYKVGFIIPMIDLCMCSLIKIEIWILCKLYSAYSVVVGFASLL